MKPDDKAVLSAAQILVQQATGRDADDTQLKRMAETIAAAVGTSAARRKGVQDLGDGSNDKKRLKLAGEVARLKIKELVPAPGGKITRAQQLQLNSSLGGQLHNERRINAVLRAVIAAQTAEDETEITQIKEKVMAEESKGGDATDKKQDARLDRLESVVKETAAAQKKQSETLEAILAKLSGGAAPAPGGGGDDDLGVTLADVKKRAREADAAKKKAEAEAAKAAKAK